jgi:hypothetical protein
VKGETKKQKTKEPMKAKVKSFEDLDVYQKLCELHLEVNKLSLSFPKFELHELGSQIRRSSLNLKL